MPLTTCRSCGGALERILTLGKQHLSDFRTDDAKPPRFPLTLMRCEACTLVQLADSVPPELMYHDRYGFKSGVSQTIRDDHADIVQDALTHVEAPKSWLDIACNDGTLLSNVPTSVYRAGIDPVRKYAHEAWRHADRIVPDYFDPIYFTGETFDVITSISVFYDLDRPDVFVQGVASLLADHGVWAVQQNYWIATLEQSAVDNVCHEHRTYFSLASMEPLLARHGLRVFNVATSSINGGSFRTLICKGDTFDEDDSVQAMRDRERLVDTPETHAAFAGQVARNLEALADLVHSINHDGGRVYIYGASTRGGTIWQAAGLDVDDLPYAVERNPEKVGRKIASIGVPIISEQQARDDHPEYMLVSIWFNRDEVIAREHAYLEAGGKLIFPLPELEVVALAESLAA